MCQTDRISWIYRGTELANNSVLTFNKGDSLNVVCATFVYTSGITGLGALTKGSTPPSNIDIALTAIGYFQMSYTNPGTLIMSMTDGIAKGFENFSFMFLGQASNQININILISQLRSEDSGTYHCGGIFFTLEADLSITGKSYKTSGALTLVVNTKAGQSRSSKDISSKFLTYSAAILGASKIFI